MNDTNFDNMETDEQDIARLLQAAEPRQELPEALKLRWEQHFLGELEQKKRHRMRKRQYTFGAIAAGLMAVGFAALLNTAPDNSTPLTISATKVFGDSSFALNDIATTALISGQKIPVDAVLTTGDSGFIALSYGAYDVRMREDSKVQLNGDSITVEYGEIYLSDEAGNAFAQSLTVKTRFGTIEDIGTQFSVAVSSSGVTSKVRRGAIIIKTASREYRADASGGTAKSISFGSSDIIEVADTASDDWHWIYAGASDYRLEGQSAFDFLRWSTLETGLTLEYLSSAAEIYAKTTILHGDISDLDPAQAVVPVLASTHLIAQRSSHNTLQISLAPR